MFTRSALLILIISMTAALLSACGGGERRQVIQNKGSDTLVNVAQAWAEAYQAVNPDVVVAVSGGGSGTGIAALINGTVDIANASRAIKDSEIEQARDNGHDPIQHMVGYDALAIFLHADNPIDEISIAQLKEIYVDGGSTLSWTDLGVEVPGCQDQEIVVVSRQNNSGTYAYFREAVLGEAGLPPGHARHARLQGCRRPGREDALRHRLQRPGLRHRPRQNALRFTGARQRLRRSDRCDRGGWQLPDRPPAVHVHQRRADRPCRRLPELDQERRRPVYYP